MGSDLFLSASLGVSVVTTILFGLHGLLAGRRYRRYHDDRSALELAVAVSLTIASAGLSLSVAGFILGDLIMTATGMSIARVALLLLALVVTAVDLDEAWDRRKQR